MSLSAVAPTESLDGGLSMSPSTVDNRSPETVRRVEQQHISKAALIAASVRVGHPGPRDRKSLKGQAKGSAVVPAPASRRVWEGVIAKCISIDNHNFHLWPLTSSEHWRTRVRPEKT